LAPRSDGQMSLIHFAQCGIQYLKCRIQNI
jgi:hypothetical protein